MTWNAADTLAVLVGGVHTHRRFFTRRSLRRLILCSGLDLFALEYTGLPFDVLSRSDTRNTRLMRRLDRALVGVRPTVLGSQFVARLTPHQAGSLTLPRRGETRVRPQSATGSAAAPSGQGRKSQVPPN